jgi:NADH dehydrogenase
MRILLTGASGFLGFHVARALVARGHFVSCMVRLGSEGKLRLPDRRLSERVSGDLTELDSLYRKPMGCDAAVNLVGIAREVPALGQTFEEVHVEGVGNLIESCLESEVSRLIHVSALGAGPNAADPFRRTKHRGEERVRRSPMRWTVLRPALIYGAGSPTLNWMFRLTYGAPLLPVPVPRRRERIRPIWVEDLAAGIAACLERPGTGGRTLDAAGPEAMTVGGMVAAVARRRGVPHWQVGSIPGLPGPPELLDLLAEEAAADPRAFVEATAVDLTPMAEALRARRPDEAPPGRP